MAANEVRGGVGSRRGRVPRGLIGMLGLILAVESGLAAIELDISSVWRWDWKVSGRVARRKADRYDVLCFGDSLVKFGVVPRVLGAGLDRSVYNLALGGGQAPSSYILLKRAIDSGAKPEAILVDFWPDLLKKGPLQNAPLFGELADLGECIDLGLATGEASFAGSAILTHHFPSIRLRNEIRTSILAAFRGEASSARKQTVPFWRNWRQNLGAVVWPRNPDGAWDVDALPQPQRRIWTDALYPVDWASDPVNADYLKRFLKLARDHRIPTILLITPLPKPVQARREIQGADARYTAFVGAIQARFPDLVVIDARRSGYDRVFMDYVHLDRRGAIAFSDQLAGVLRPYLDGRGVAILPRRVALPAYRERPMLAELESEVEDTRQSELAFEDDRAGTTRRR